jgi:hypothetical protein
MPDQQIPTSLVDYVTAIGAIATPIMVAILSGIGLKLKQRIERQNQLEDKLRDDRINTYNEILEPFILFLTSDAAWESDPKNRKKNKVDIATRKMLSLDYRKAGFKLSLVGSDEVVSAYNNLMQLFYQAGDNPSHEVALGNLRTMMDLLGTFLLEIRRSMGNEHTELDNWEMLEWFLKDAREQRDAQ